MKRVYDFGALNNRRDFNGDVDGDNDVDITDRMKYQTWYFNMSGQLNTVINLSSAEPYDIFTMPPT